MTEASGWAGLLRKLGGRIRRSGGRQSLQQFQTRRQAFQRMLESYVELLRILSILEELGEGRRIFSLAHVRGLASRAVFHGLRMVKAYAQLVGSTQPKLTWRVRDIGEGLRSLLEPSPRSSAEGPLFLTLDEAAKAPGEAGSKAANLGRLAWIGLPTPEGFVITSKMFQRFTAPLWDDIRKAVMNIDPAEPESFVQTARRIRVLFRAAELPGRFSQELWDSLERIAKRSGTPLEELRLTFRPSVVLGDGADVCAGQHTSVIGVGAGEAASAYRDVAASLFSARAMAYRLRTGLPDETASMAVACMRMIEPESAGVLYTRDPQGGEPAMLLQAVWGLADPLIDGTVSPDAWRISCDGRKVLGRSLESKDVRQVMGEAGPVFEDVPLILREQPCLDAADVLRIAGLGAACEDCFGGPQDIEWAKDNEDRIWLLQCRPLAVCVDAESGGDGDLASAEVLSRGGATAMPGAGAGPVVHVRSKADLAGFPEDGVIVASHSSPSLAPALSKASAVVTEHGGVTGRLASLCRELGVPTIIAMPGAMENIPAWDTATVDASRCAVYRGMEEAVLAGRHEKTGVDMRSTPVFELLLKAMDLISPLGLVDPSSEDFQAENCSSLHDVMRFVRAQAYGEVRSLLDHASTCEGFAKRLRETAGLNLHIVDVGGGLAASSSCAADIALTDVESALLRAFLEGLLAVQGDGAEQIEPPVPPEGAKREGDKSYAIASESHLHCSFRAGDAHCFMDSYCGQAASKNYVTFLYLGASAAGQEGGLLSEAVASLLKRLGFSVERTGDRVGARFLEHPPALVESRLRAVGGLVQYVACGGGQGIGEVDILSLAGDVNEDGDGLTRTV